MDYQIISKGYYSYSQNNEQITVKQFMFALKEDKKCLLLRFTNNEEGTLSGIDFLVQELDDRGNKIGEQIIKAKKIYAAGGESFSINEDIFVHDNCTDFKAVVLAADFGDYKYSYKKDIVSVSYDPIKDNELNPEIKKSMGMQKKSISAKNFKVGGFLLLVTVLIVIASLGITWAQLTTFVNSTTVFTMDNIEYEFVNGTLESGQITISNYKGYETNITIPSKINDLEIVAIKEGAFSGKKLTSVKIEGSLAIGDEAFSGCTDLKSISLGKTSVIGAHAFYGCTSLEKIESNSMVSVGERAFEDCLSLSSITFNGEQKLTLYNNVFKNCPRLKEVIISQDLELENGVSNIFNGDFEIETIVFDSVGITGANSTLHSLYGKTYAENAIYSLKSITLGHVDSINPNFFKNFTNLETITIHDLSRKSAGESAFENCYKLQKLNFDDLTSIGNSAFKNTAIKSINIEAIEYLGINAFQNCTNLDVDLSKFKLTSIPESAFSGCTSLKTIVPSLSVKEIGKHAFEYCTSATNIVLQKEITYVGLGAFEGCSSLQSITLPFLGESKTSALNHFAYIFGNGNSNYNESQVKVPASLKKITFNNDVSEISDNAFYHCLNVESITLPTTITKIGTNAFCGCSSLKELSLPNTLKTINPNAFLSCSSLTSIYIPTSVMVIGSNILGENTSIREITIPFIGAGREDTFNTFKYFFGDSSKTGIVPDSLKTIKLLDTEQIPKEAFKGLNRIENVILSNNVKSIGISAFEGCSSLVGINFTDQITEIQEKAFYKSGLESLSIPANIISIGNNAFANSEISSVEFLGETIYLGQSAFENTKIEAIELPIIPTIGLDSNPFITSNIFKGCKYLKTITQKEIGNTATSFIYEKEFYDCEALESVQLASYITSIGQGAFEGCTSIKEMTLPFIGTLDGNESTCIGEIFGSASYINASSYVPSSLKYITITNATIVPTSAFAGLSNIKNIKLNEGITKIKNLAFKGCSSLNEINIPESVLEIADNIFNECYKLAYIINLSGKSVIAPSPLEVFTSIQDYNDKANKVTQDGYEFYRAGVNYSNEWFLVDYDHSLIEMNLPVLPSIQKYNIINYFANNNSIVEKVSIPSSVLSIGKYAFNGCSSLKDLSFTQNSLLTTIDDYAFYNCYLAKEAKIPDGVESIGASAFENCSSLTVVYVPSSITIIKDLAFNGCKNLFDVYDLGSSLTIECESKENGQVAENALLIHKNKSEKSLYDSTYDNFVFKTNGSQWILYSINGTTPSTLDLKEFTSIEDGAMNGKVFSYRVLKDIFINNSLIKSIIVSNAVTDLPKESFKNCKNLTSVDMSNANSLTKVNEGLFLNCSNLTNIAMPSSSTSLISIGNNAFKECYSLKSITIPESVDAIGSNAFKNCYSLETATIPDSVTIINESTFENCYRLYNVILPNNLKTISQYAFKNCKGLATIVIPSLVDEIQDFAFDECQHLYGVVNLSSNLSIAKDTNNGLVGLYSYERVTDPTSTTVVSVKDNNGFYFVRYYNKWFLYSIPGNSTDTVLSFPESFMYEDEQHESFDVDAKAYTYPNSKINTLFISSAVTSLYSYWFYKENGNFTGTIYYKGTQADFVKIAQSASYGVPTQVYFYASCVHESNQWTYIDGEVSTTVNEHVLVRSESTNCNVELTNYYECPVCKHTYTEIVQNGTHDLDENNECKVCHWTLINASNINKQKSITSTNANAITFKNTTTNTIITFNALKQKEVTLTITAEQSMEVAFDYLANVSSYSTLYILYDGVVAKEMSGTGNKKTSYYKELSAGHYITIKFKCTATQIQDCADQAFIYDLKIKEK